MCTSLLVGLLAPGSQATVQAPEGTAVLDDVRVLIAQLERPAQHGLGALLTQTGGLDRIAKEAMQIGPARIEAGDRVMLSVAGANRDPAVFEHPERFVLERPNVKRQLGFGLGIHGCLRGAALPRLETRLAVERLAAVAERIEVTGDLEYRPSTTHRGLVCLPVRFQSRPRR